MNGEDHPLDPLADSSVSELDAVTRDRIESGLRVQYAARTSSAPRRPRVPRQDPAQRLPFDWCQDELDAAFNRGRPGC